MSNFGWCGEKVRLVPLDKERHFANAHRWVNDPDVTWRTLIGDIPITRLAEEQFFDHASELGPHPTELHLAIETLDDPPEHVGMVGIHKIDYRHRHGEVGIMIGRTALWGRGFGSDALATITRYAFEVLGLEVLVAGVMADNVGSRKAIEKAGYERVGCIPQFYWKRGARHDSILYARLRSNDPEQPSEHSA
jgi:ribosomal-protein-alanine N-acetyltransferase